MYSYETTKQFLDSWAIYISLLPPFKYTPRIPQAQYESSISNQTYTARAVNLNRIFTISSHFHVAIIGSQKMPSSVFFAGRRWVCGVASDYTLYMFFHVKCAPNWFDLTLRMIYTHIARKAAPRHSYVINEKYSYRFTDLLGRRSFDGVKKIQKVVMAICYLTGTTRLYILILLGVVLVRRVDLMLSVLWQTELLCKHFVWMH